MSELETTPATEGEDLSDELSDEALDRLPEGPKASGTMCSRYRADS
jgi:hypothetical protein